MNRASRFKSVRTRKAALAVVGLLTLAVSISACSESSSSSASSEKGEKITSGLFFYGPRDDGGWNVANWTQTEPKLEEELGDDYVQQEVENTPFDSQATQLAEGFVTKGSNVLVDMVGLGELFTKPCEKNMQVKCIQVSPASKLPSNTTGFWPAEQYPEYVAGVAAGLTTKSNDVGYIAAYDIPQLNGAINAFAIGCRAVNPECTVRVVLTNDYYTPPKSNQAASSLIDAGVDVLRTSNDDSSFCTTAKDRGVSVVANYADASEQCGEALITSTVFDFSKYFVKQLNRIHDGKFKSEQTYFLPPEEYFTLGEFGPNVEPKTQKAIETAYDEIIAGEIEPFEGPLKDDSGKVQLPKGQKLSDKFVYAEWEWTPPGIVRSK